MFSKHKMYKKNMQMSYSKMSFTYSKEKAREISCYDEHFLRRRRQGWNCSWVITLYHCYLSVWWDVNLSDLPGAAQRAEFNAGHPGAKLAAGPAEEHQPATTCILLLAQSPWIWTPPPPPSSLLLLQQHPLPPPPALTSLICIPVISYSHS